MFIFNEKENLISRIKELDKQLEDANEVIDFYGDESNWDLEIIYGDCSIVYNELRYDYEHGGKRAREYQAKYGEQNENDS